jgi:hypothetical protein
VTGQDAGSELQPDRIGFRFANQWPEGTKAVPWLPRSILGLRFNDAGDGLCGGMVFAAVDYQRAKLPPPDSPTAPPAKDPLFAYFVRRLISSWHIPIGPFRYLFLMNPLVSDRKRAKVMAQQAQRAAAALDAGDWVPFGLIRMKSWNPSNLRNQHQVVAWKYRRDGDGIVFSIYDPNAPATEVRMALSSTKPGDPVTVSYVPDDGEPVFCFFGIRYREKTPPTG